MHELALTQSILRIVEEAAQGHEVKRVKEVRLKIGDYSGVVPQSLAYYFDLLSRDTVAAGAQLRLERLPLLMTCRSCRWQGEIDKHHIQCPQCGCIDLHLDQGREFYVESIEVE
jgi:hydrogenase nickel incorporation protein HypA/HybF